MSQWQPIETAPRDGTQILATTFVRNIRSGKGWWEPNVIWWTEDESEWDRGWSFDDYLFWQPIIAPEQTP